MSDIQIFGHPRSGTHYVAALVDQNLYDGSDYLRHYQRKYPHATADRLESIRGQNRWLPVYVYRDCMDVMRSVFSMRGRFGLNVNDFQTFLRSVYSDMWTDNMDFVIDADFIHWQKQSSKVARLFENVDETPIEYWRRHTSGWLRHNEVFPVSYDKVKNDPLTFLQDLACALDMERPTEVTEIERRVGWKPRN